MPKQLDRHATSDLVRLHAMLEHAKQLARDQSEQGRHVALISLDGVVEYAMGLAALNRQLGLSPQARFHDTLRKLVDDLGADWQQAVRKGVLRVHQARNQAQHGGVTPDAAYMGGWTDEVDAFVKSLVWAAFGVELDDVLLADAINDEELQVGISAAESAIEANDPQLGFSIAYETFCAARLRWHDQQEDAYGYMPPPYPRERDPRHVDPSERGADYADVSVFASDLGEYHWLITTQRLVTNDLPATLDDARRALQFAYHWILRWQQFDARYPRERWRQHFESLSPPSSGDGPPRIESVEVPGSQMLGHRDLHKVVVQLVNLPARGRDDWGIDMKIALRSAASQAGASDAILIYGTRTATGRLTVLAGRALTTDQLAECLQLAVDEATRLYRARRDQAEQRASEAASLAAEFSAIFVRYDGFPGDVETSRDVGQSGDTLQLTAEYTGAPHELREIAGILRSRGGHLASTSHRDGCLVLEAFRLDDDSRAKLDEALGAAIEQVAYRRRVNDERERDRLALEQGLQALLGAPVPTASPPEE